MRETKRLLALLVMLCMMYVPVHGEEETHQVVVVNGQTSDRVHLREKPSTQATSLGLYFTGTEAQCLSNPSLEWVRVRIGVEEGYMMPRYLASPYEQVASLQPTGVVWTRTAALYSRPDVQCEASHALAWGQDVRVEGETKSGWYAVRLMTGEQGYVPVDDVVLLANAPASVQEARTQAYETVLDGNGTFVDVDAWEGENVLTLSDYLRRMDGDASFTGMAQADFDADGAWEVLLRVQREADEEYLLLDAPQGKSDVLGCTLSYRAFLSPKEDGSFSYASSAAEYGCGHVTLFEDGYRWTSIAESLVDDEGRVYYTVCGKRCAEEAWEAVLTYQAQKADLSWIPAQNGRFPTEMLMME